MVAHIFLDWIYTLHFQCEYCTCGKLFARWKEVSLLDKLPLSITELWTVVRFKLRTVGFCTTITELHWPSAYQIAVTP